MLTHLQFENCGENGIEKSINLLKLIKKINRLGEENKLKKLFGKLE
jgi:hypothetical protein